VSLGALVGRLDGLDPGYRAMLPSRRTIQTHCTDLGVIHHAEWANGELGPITDGPAARADIRIELTSAVLGSLANGTVRFREAYARQHLRIDASLTDMLRLRAVL
jgi:hypothetical protein